MDARVEIGAACYPMQVDHCPKLKTSTRDGVKLEASVMRCSKILELPRGKRLNLDTSKCRKLWIVKSGMVALCTGLADGRRQIQSLEVPGNFVCGLAVREGSEGWLKAMSDTLLCEIDLSSMQGPLSNYPDMASSLFWLLHDRLRQTMDHQVVLGRLDSVERVAHFFLDLALRIGKPHQNGRYLELPMTRQDIADYLGLNTETVSRSLTRLRKAGLVCPDGRTAYSLPDLKALQRRAPMHVPDLASVEDSCDSQPQKEIAGDY